MRTPRNRTCLSLLLVAGLIGATAWAEQGHGQVGPARDAGAAKAGVFYSHDFETDALEKPWSKGGGWSLSTEEKYGGNKCLDMFYKATYPSSDKPRDQGGCGYAMLWFKKPVKEFHARWYEKLSSNFVFSSVATKGWSVWTTDNSQTMHLTIDNTGHGERYPSMMPQKGGDGHHKKFPANATPFVWTGDKLGRWVQIETRLKLNTPGKNDGVYQEWIDGVLRCDYSDVNYGSHEAFNMLELSGFWNIVGDGSVGPDGKKIRPHSNMKNGPGEPNHHLDMHRYIDNIVLAEGDVYIGPATGVEPAPKALPPGKQ